MPKAHSAGSTPPVVGIAPDSFKGSLSAEQVAEAISNGIRRARADAVIRIVPMADGGEGTLDAMLAAGGERRVGNGRGAASKRGEAATGLLADGSASGETAGGVGIPDPDRMGRAGTARRTRGIGD